MANDPTNIAALLKGLAAIASQVNERADVIDEMTDDEARAYFVAGEEARDGAKLQVIAALSEAEAAVQRLRVLALVRLAEANGGHAAQAREDAGTGSTFAMALINRLNGAKKLTELSREMRGNVEEWTAECMAKINTDAGGNLVELVEEAGAEFEKLAAAERELAAAIESKLG